MKKNIIILGLIIILTAATTYFVSRPKPDVNPYYLREIENSREREDSIKSELNKTLNEINQIKSILNEKDSTIDNANSVELDSLFANFFNRFN
jgi:peptidoglycan hydrolase CwlO-like protein